MSELALPQTNINDELAKSLTKTGDYLPYFTVTGANSEVVKQDKIKQGILAIISNQNPTDLGKECVMVIIAERAKAMVFKEGTVLSYFDPNSDGFKTAYQNRDVKDSSMQAGLEFLVWLPMVGETGAFATMMLASKTLRKEAAMVRQFLKGKTLAERTATAKAHYIKPTGSKFSWWGIKFAPHTSPIGVTPDQEEYDKQVQLFTNPKSSVVETVANASAERPR